MERISEIEGEPTIGKFYLVPCVLDAYFEWIPIIGPEHDDAEIIGQSQRHWHRDLRFMSLREIQAVYGRYREVDCSMEAFAMTSIMVTSYLTGGPVERKVKCRRRMPDFPIGVREHAYSWFPELQQAYQHERLSCQRCPHRGMPLKGLPVKDGVVICPGHGLAFNLQTGKMVSRLK